MITTSGRKDEEVRRRKRWGTKCRKRRKRKVSELLELVVGKIGCRQIS